MAAFSLLVLPLFLGIAEGVLVTVCSSGCNSTTIQNGINLASNYDEVRIIDSREYNESVVLNKTSMSLTSNSSTFPLIFSDSNNLSPFNATVNITSSNVTLSRLDIKYNGTAQLTHSIASNGNNTNFSTNITIVNVTASTSNGKKNNYGIYFIRVSNSTINNVTVKTNGTGDANHGIYLISSSIRNNITNTKITTNGTRINYGVYIYDSSQNVLSGNSISTSGTDNNYALRIDSGSSNNSIFSNTLQTNGSGTDNYGIYMESNNGNNVTGNTIKTNGTGSDYGVFFASSNNNYLVSNTLQTDGGNNNYGILFQSGSNNILDSNSIYTAGTSGSNYGIYFSSGTGNKISNGIVNTNGVNNNYGIYFASSNNLVENSNVSTNGIGTDNYGVFISGSNNVNVTNSIVSTNGTVNNHGIYFSSTGTSHTFDSTINTSQGDDVFLTGAGGAHNFVNVTFNKSEINVSSSATGAVFYMKYRLDILVKDQQNNAIGNVLIKMNTSNNITITNTTNTSITNSSGHTPTIFLSEFMANVTYNLSSGYLYFSNYTINASKTGYLPVSVSVNMTESRVINITLLSSPDIQPPTYSNSSTNSTIAGKPTLFSLSWADDNVLNSTAKNIFSSNNTGTWVNSSAYNFTSSMTSEASNYTMTLNSTSGIIVVWCWYANDTSNNWNGTSCNNPFVLVTTSNVTAPADTIITVCSSGCNSTGVQEAINKAENGYEVRITDSGEYFENVTVNKSIALTGNATTKPKIIGVASLPAVNITSDNVAIRNLTIKYNGSSSFGTITAKNRLNITIANSTVTNDGGNSGYGVFFFSTNSSRIENNTITTSGGSDNYGIYVQSSSNDNVTANSVTTGGTGTNYGIWLDTSINSTVTSNSVSTSGSSSNNFGIHLLSSPSNNVSSNIVSTGGTSSNFGIWISSSSSNTVSTNNISTYGSGGSNYGLYLSSSSSNVLSSDNITTSGVDFNYGIHLTSSSHHNTFRNMRIDSSIVSSYGILIDGSNNNTFYDSTVSAPSANDIRLAGVSGTWDNYLVNSSFNKTDIGVNSASVSTKLFVQYHLDVMVVNSTGNALNGSSVTGNDTNSVLNSENPTSGFSATTNTTGQITVQTLSEFMTNGTYNSSSGYLYFNNYTINASKSGYDIISVQLNLTQTKSTSVNITLIASVTTPADPVITVCSSGCNSTGVQEAINKAANGYEVRIIDSRAYNESVVINKSSLLVTSNSTIPPMIFSDRTEPASNQSDPPVNVTANNFTIARVILKFNGTHNFQMGTITFRLVADGRVYNTTILNYGGSNSGNGILSSNSSKIIIENNTIDMNGSAPSGRHSIYIVNGSGSVIRFNNVLNDEDGSSAAISIESSSNVSTTNNTLNVYGGDNTYGIWVQSSAGNNISNNTIYTNSGNFNYGIFISSSNESAISGNSINTDGTSSNYGVRLTSSPRTIMTSNWISTRGSNSNYGIHASTSSSIALLNNTVSTNGTIGDNYGIHLSTVTNSNFKNITIVTNGVSNNYGINFQNSSDNTLDFIYITSKSTSQGNSSYGIHFGSGTNNTISNSSITTNNSADYGVNIGINSNMSTNFLVNSTIIAHQAFDINMASGIASSSGNTSSLFIINTQFNKSDIGFFANSSVNSSGKVFNGYYVYISVINASGSRLDSVSVVGNDTNSVSNLENPSSNFSMIHNFSSSGVERILYEFMANGTYNSISGYLYFTNYTINASKSGYNTTSISINLTASTLINITLTNTSGQSSNVDTYYILNNGLVEVVIANISSGRRNTGGFINISDVDPTVTGEMKRAYLNGTELYHRMDVYEDNSAEGVFGTVTKDVGGAGDSECHMSISTNIFKRVDCTTTKGTGRSKISYRIWKGVPYIDMYVFLAGTNNTNYLDTLPMPFAPSDPGASPPPGYGDARVTFNSNGCLASVGTDQGNCNSNKGVIDIPYKLSGGEVTYDLNLSLENPWIVDYRTTSGYKGAVQVWDCDGFTNPIRNECGDVLYRFKAAGSPYFWQTFPQNTSSGSVTGGTNSSFTRRYGLFLNGSLSWANVGIRESTIFVSNQSITNSTGGCVKDYSGDTLKCYPSSGVLSFSVTPNQNVTKMFITVENFTASTNSLFIYNSTSGTPSSGDLWIMLSNESGTWKYVNQTGGVSAKGCLINGTSIDENVCNDTGVYKDANNVMLFLSMVSGTQNIAIRDSAISSSSTTTTTTGSSGGGGGGGGGASPTTTTTLRNEPKERVIVPVEEIVPVEVPTDLPDVKIPEHVPNRIIKASAEILELKKDESAVIDIKNADMAIRRADIQYEEDVKDVTVTIRQLVFKPKEVEEPETDVYRYIEINSSSDKVKTAKISFEVEESWISGRDDDIRLNHFKGGWKELPTKKTGKNGNRVKYEAETDSFSVFVISIAVPVTGEVSQETAAPAVQIHESLPYKPLIITILLILVIASFIKLQSVEKELKSRKLKVNVSSILQNPRSFEGARITLTDCVVNTFKQNGADWVSTANDGTGTINAIYSKKIDGKMSLEGVVAITSSGDPVLRIKKSKG